jgi:hypothetical protein
VLTGPDPIIILLTKCVCPEPMRIQITKCVSLCLQALEDEEESQKRGTELLGMDERKRPYNSMYNEAAPSEDQMEAWRMKQRHFEDPMNHF